MGAPTWPPYPPYARRAPAQPWRASLHPLGLGAPTLAPCPIRSSRPGAAVARLVTPARPGGPDLGPMPHTLVAPRRSRGAPRYTRSAWGPRPWPHAPYARRAPAQPWRASLHPLGLGAPTLAPCPIRSSRPGAAVARLVTPARPGGPDLGPMPHTLVAPRRSRGAPRYTRSAWGPRPWPHAPYARRAPAQPWRASLHPLGLGAPTLAPCPIRSSRPGAAVARLVTPARPGGPDLGPMPHTLVAPRRSRGAPRYTRSACGPRPWPHAPYARRAPAQPWRASLHPLGLRAPTLAPCPIRSSRPGAAVARLVTSARPAGPDLGPMPHTLVAPRRSRGAPRQSSSWASVVFNRLTRSRRRSRRTSAACHRRRSALLPGV